MPESARLLTEGALTQMVLFFVNNTKSKRKYIFFAIVYVVTIL